MTYQEFLEYILRLENLPSLDYGTIGYSTLGEPIYYAHYGNYTGKQIIIEGSIHAREYLAGVLVAELARHTAETSPIIDGGIYFIPNINPDGVRLVLDGITDYYCPKLQEVLLAINDGNTDFGLWKANINGVDLNVNFDALWGGGSQNVFCLSSGNFVGYYPSSEREVRELIDFTNLVQPALTISYHTKGEEIYFNFFQEKERLARDEKVAKRFADSTGYKIKNVEAVSSGGLKDWCVKKLKIPALTIELGNDELTHPIKKESLEEIFEKNKSIAFDLEFAYNEFEKSR